MIYEVQLGVLADGAKNGDIDYDSPSLMLIEAEYYPSIAEVEETFDEEIKKLGCDCVYGITPLEEWELETYECYKTAQKYKIYMTNKKIKVTTVNVDGVEIEHKYNSVEELQKAWCSEECPCPNGDDEVLGYSIDGLWQDTHNIKENKYGYRDFSSLLKILGVKDNQNNKK